MNRIMSVSQIARVFGVLVMLLLLMSMIVALAFFEAWYLNYFIHSYISLGDALFSLFAAVLVLFFSSLTLCILCLNLATIIPSTGLLQLVIPTVMLFAYLRLPQLLSAQSLVFLASGKVLSSVLLIRFWHAQFRVFRMRHGATPDASIYLRSLAQFLECRWVLLGTWLLANLAFSLALVVQQTVLQLQGWEGLLILLTFFALFWVFIRNPNSQ